MRSCACWHSRDSENYRVCVYKKQGRDQYLLVIYHKEGDSAHGALYKRVATPAQDRRDEFRKAIKECLSRVCDITDYVNTIGVSQEVITPLHYVASRILTEIPLQDDMVTWATASDGTDALRIENNSELL